jgi:hypothetical protein
VYNQQELLGEVDMPGKVEKLEVFNINTPGKSSFVQKEKYEEVKRVLKEYMPSESPGLTQDEMATLVIENVSGKVFDDRTKAGWWMKTVQLDLEARQIMIREKSKPARWYYEKAKNEILPEVTTSKVIKKKAVLALPAHLRNILIQEDVLAAYEARPFYQRNDYIQWITSAKREETISKRIAQMVEELRSGTLYMNMEYNGDKN